MEKAEIANLVNEIIEQIKEKLSSIVNELNEAEEAPFHEDYAVINGIRLKRTNETLRYCEHFDWDEAQWIAESRNIRVPTQDEWATMLAAGNTWDEECKGLWIGEKHAMKQETGRSTFLPAAGYRTNGGTVHNVGTGWNYWSSTASASGAYRLGFHSSRVSPWISSARANGFSVRCLAE